MTTAREDMVEMATARANVYGLLAGVFRAEPSASFLAQFQDPQFAGTLESLGLSLGEEFERTSQDQLAEDLAVEFTKLFIGPGPHLSPHESLHAEEGRGLEGSYWGPATVKVKKFMETAGLTIDDEFPGMPDHISVELEFMQQLATKESEAWAEPNDEFATNLLHIEKMFYDEHLSRWVGSFCDKVIEQSEHPFYQGFAEMTKGFIEYEGETLRGFIAHQDGPGENASR
jgi:TorA maturation chaperone TorD